jgi:hypothetical protein
MDKSMTTFVKIMAFYMLLTYVLAPVVFYYAFGRTLTSAGNGFIAGSILCIALWHFFGKKMAY